jgi:sulfite exporter TauE/SafE
MNATFWLGVLTASLLGSLHCAAMCGGLLPVYAVDADGSRRGSRHLAYNLGRGTSYLLLGAWAGGVGSLIDRSTSWLAWQRPAAWLAGAAMALIGIKALLDAVGYAPQRGQPPSWMARRSAATIRALRGLPGTPRAIAVGVVSVLLPCGWLWSFVIAAAGTGRVGAGVMTMLAFWLGTLPMMFSLGAVFSLASRPLLRRAPILTALMMIALGFTTWFVRAPLASVPTADTVPSCHGQR